MNLQQKKAVLEDVKTDIGRAAGVLFVDFTGLTVEEADDFRGKLRAEGIRYSVVKNTLIKKAVADTDYENAADLVFGSPTGVVMGFDDPVASAKLLFDYSEECDHIRIKGGILDNKAITTQEAEALSKMPSKAEIQGSLVTLALSPGRQLAGQIRNPAGRIVGAVEALVDRLGDQAA